MDHSKSIKQQQQKMKPSFGNTGHPASVLHFLKGSTSKSNGCIYVCAHFAMWFAGGSSTLQPCKLGAKPSSRQTLKGKQTSPGLLGNYTFIKTHPNLVPDFFSNSFHGFLFLNLIEVPSNFTNDGMQTWNEKNVQIKPIHLFTTLFWGEKASKLPFNGYIDSLIPRKFQHTPRAHPRQSPLPILKRIPL